MSTGSFWPGAGTQTYAQVDTEAGPHGFDDNYFVAQVAGLSQIAGEFMHVAPRVIDLGWGQLKTAVVATKDARLLSRYVDAFRKVETRKDEEARSALRELSGSIAATDKKDRDVELHRLIETQLSKLS